MINFNYLEGWTVYKYGLGVVYTAYLFSKKPDNWLQNYHTCMWYCICDLTSVVTAHWMGMKKFQKLDDLKKFAISKKGIGIESQKLYMQTS